ncbi:hypothetical protein [Nonomuraea sp. NPDC049646]|uniref:hypothetical protein n=1 Tax=unclassified Nonomuraea TaxID=2593643 RepID=UPI00378DA50F
MPTQQRHEAPAATPTPEQTAAAINARPPNCLVPPPSILIEGGEKSGKSWLCAELTASPLVGDSFWLDLGEAAGDEYGDAITGQITYQMLQHDGSWHSIMQRVREVHAHAAAVRAAGGKPVVLVVDSASAMWDMLKTWADVRARSSRKNRAILERDPNAEITVPPNVWTDVHHRRHIEFLKMLITFEGILLITARGRETAKIGKDGNPVVGETDYKIESQRDIPFAVTAHVRMFRDEDPVIMGCRSKHMRIGQKFEQPRRVGGFTLEQFIFKGLRFDPAATARRDYVECGSERTPESVRDDALAAHQAGDREKLLELLAEAGHPALMSTTVTVDGGDEAGERLLDLIVRLGRALDAPLQQDEQQEQRSAQARPPIAPGNRFARLQADRSAQDVPAAPANAGSSPDERADGALLDRLDKALTACDTRGAAQLAVCSALVGHQIRQLPDLTRSQANRIGQYAQAALAQASQVNKTPREVLTAMVGQALKNRQQAQQGKTGKAA